MYSSDTTGTSGRVFDATSIKKVCPERDPKAADPLIINLEGIPSQARHPASHVTGMFTILLPCDYLFLASQITDCTFLGLNIHHIVSRLSKMFTTVSYLIL